VSGFFICVDDGAFVGAGWAVGDTEAPTLEVEPPVDEFPDVELETGCVADAGAQEASATEVRITIVNITIGARLIFLIFFLLVKGLFLELISPLQINFPWLLCLC